MARILTAVVLIPLVILLLFRAPFWAVTLATGTVAILAGWEYLALAYATGAQTPRWLVLIAVALATNAGIWQEIGEQMNQVHLSEDQVERLGPMASAQELVALRREIFASHGF